MIPKIGELVEIKIDGHYSGNYAVITHEFTGLRFNNHPVVETDLGTLVIWYTVKGWKEV